ncbi:hypothetical protein QYE76_058666 [Lolium multiflorum]|uniref:CCHC-type domain-containing protein n=1 Tax=Lolium multiflorum TaxID=4521 RepID=A0AAD8WQ44_LOLMU|nr:hypothetical protein QYE76_058666 [Lolium multiflorum]
MQPKKKEAANVSVFERLGPLPPQSKRAESPRWADLEDSDDEDKKKKKIGTTVQGGALMDSAVPKSAGFSDGLEEAESPTLLVAVVLIVAVVEVVGRPLPEAPRAATALGGASSSSSSSSSSLSAQERKRLNMNKELPELFSMRKSAEIEIKKEHQVLMVNKTTSFKKQGKPNNKGNFKKSGKKAVAPPVKPKAGPKPDTECYYCKEKGHWKRNCPKYLADLKSGHVKKKGIFDI